MDSVIKKKWVDALRSGKYRQARMQLKERNPGRHCSYCCLGVLCNVIDPKGWDGEWFRGIETELPFELRRGLGITEDQQNTLVSMNDDDLANFETIAQYIEENL